MNRNPLVSIPIITYNSASYILDGLESIKEQTYKNIEIIISDDCSTDQTIEICQNWIDVNQHLFERAIIVTSEINTGVAGNLNRAIRECKGEWIRCLSGDDRFYPNTISDYVDFVKANTNINICFGKLKFIHQHSKLNETIINNYRKHFEEIKNQRKQYIRYLKHHYIPGTGLFYKKSLWEKVEGFDERYPFCEEVPFTLKILELQETIYFLDKEVYGYNIHDNSLSNGGKPNWKNFRDKKKFFYDVKVWKMLKKGLIFHAYENYIQFKLTEYKYFVSPGKMTFMKKLAFSLLRCLSPIYIIRKANQIIN